MEEIRKVCEEIRRLVEEVQTKAAIEQLKQLVEREENLHTRRNEVSMLLYRWNELSQDVNLNIISHTKAAIKSAKIQHSILKLISKIVEGSSSGGANEKKTFGSLKAYGNSLGFHTPEKDTTQNYSVEIPFFGREQELLELKSFLENKSPNIFGLYGTPMIGKTSLVKEFLKKGALNKAHKIIRIKFENPHNPEQTLLETLATHNQSLDSLNFDQPTLIIIENFEECLNWKSNAQKLHTIRKKYKGIQQFLEQVAQFSTVKLILESRFQINTFVHKIAIRTLPRTKLGGVNTQFFKDLYLKEGVSEEKFNIICEHFSNHTGLLSIAHQKVDWLLENSLGKAASQPRSVTTELWTVLKEIIKNLQKTDILLLCALTLKGSMHYNDIKKVFEQHETFQKIMPFESLNSLKKKFLVVDEEDVYTLNPYLREICFDFLKNRRKREMEALLQLSYFAQTPLPQYNLAIQALDRGDYGTYFKQVRQLRKEKQYEEVHEILQYTLENAPQIQETYILNQIAITYKVEKKYPEAIETLEKSIRIDANNAPSYDELAIIYKLQERYELAIETLQKAIKVAPENIPSYNELAIIYKLQRNYLKAIEVLLEAIDIDPKDVKALNELAITYLKIKEYDKALDIVKQGLTLESQGDYFYTTKRKILKAKKREQQKEQKEAEKALKAQQKKERLAQEKAQKEQQRKQREAEKRQARQNNLQELYKQGQVKLFLDAALNKAETLNQPKLITTIQQQQLAFTNLESAYQKQQINNQVFANKIIPIRMALTPIWETLKQEMSPPTKILMLTATPAETNRIGLDKEHSRISEKLQNKTKEFSLFRKRAINKTELKERTEEIKPHILHFSGHGDQAVEGQQLGGIALQNEDKNGVELLSAKKLDGLFEYFQEEMQLELVILNCCYSAEQALAIAKYVPFVIGTTKAIDDQQAISFSTGFYYKYATTKQLIKAFKSGRAEAILAGAAKIDFILYKDGQQLKNL